MCGRVRQRGLQRPPRCVTTIYGLGKDTVKTNRTIELIRVMPFGEVNHKINIAILKMLIKELFIFSFARLFEFMVGLYFLRSVQFTFLL